MSPESGWYPPGAENDPRAPWNQPDPEDSHRPGPSKTGRQSDGQEVSFRTCLDCGKTDLDDDWDEGCPEQPEQGDGPDPDLLRDIERDDRAMRDLGDD